MSEITTSAARVETARVLAEAIVCGTDNCREEGRPLTQLQQADLMLSALLAFDGIGADLDGLGDVEALLGRYRQRIGGRL